VGSRKRPSEQAEVVVGPEFDGRQPETVDVHELAPKPGPGAVSRGPLGALYLFTVLATNRVRLCPGDDAKA